MLVNWGLAMTHFQVSVGHFFLGSPDANLIWVMSYLLNMWTKQQLQQLTTMQVFDERFKLNDLKAHNQHQNFVPPELLADIQLLRQEIQAHFELIQIILNSITAQFMAEINSSVASKK